MKTFTKIPFLRIAIPFVLGIITQLNYNNLSIGWHIPLVLLVAALILSLKKISGYWNNLSIQVLADVGLFILAMQLTWQACYQNQPCYYGKLINTYSTVTCLAVLSDIPVEKEKSIKCELAIFSVKNNHDYLPAKGKIIAYFKKGLKSYRLKPGESVLLKTRFKDILPPSNPYQFDYKNYLYNRQIYHLAFVDTNSFIKVDAGPELNSLIAGSLNIKNKIINQLKKSELSSNSYAICSALLTGYDDEVDKSVIDAFSHSGTLHVLSVSGLHTGLIYMALNYLLNLVDRRKKYKFFRFLFVSLTLWGFAMITGFSAPVLRAVIMFNLFGFGKIYFRNNSKNQLNLLLVTAFVLLLYNPFFINDIGFILSFTALAGIIYFQPIFNSFWSPHNKILRHIWQSITASTAATIGTLPFTLFYFKQFPIWFVISNLVVVPLTFLLMFLALLVVLRIGFIATLTNKLVLFLLNFMSLFNKQNKGYIDGIDVSLSDAVFITALVIMLPLALQYKRYSTLLASLLLIIIWQLSALFLSYNTKTENLFTVYNVKQQFISTIKNKNLTYLNKFDSANHNFNIRPHLISFNNPEVKIGDFNSITCANKAILILDKPGFWPTCDYSKINTLVLANNVSLNAKSTAQFVSLKTIVAGSSNNRYIVRQTEELCRKFGLNFYNVSAQGAFILPLNETKNWR